MPAFACTRAVGSSGEQSGAGDAQSPLSLCFRGFLLSNKTQNLLGAFLVSGTLVMAVSHVDVYFLMKEGLLLQLQRDNRADGLRRSSPSANLRYDHQRLGS